MSTTYLEQPINKVKVRPILTNAPSQSLEMSNTVERRIHDLNESDNLPVVAADIHQSTLVERKPALIRDEKLQSRRPPTRLSKFKDATRNIVPLAIGALALEAVLTFTFDSIEGLFFIISTLAVGTSVYVSDGMKR